MAEARRAAIRCLGRPSLSRPTAEEGLLRFVLRRASRTNHQTPESLSAVTIRRVTTNGPAFAVKQSVDGPAFGIHRFATL